jgi:CRP/FNR family transcriptional regulator
MNGAEQAKSARRDNATVTGPFANLLRCTLARGDALYETSDDFQSLFLACEGFFKTCVHSPHHGTQIVDFHFPGDILGVDGFGDRTHKSDLIALTPASVIVVPNDELMPMSRDGNPFEYGLGRTFGKQFMRHQNSKLLLGQLQVHERLVAFLLDISERMAYAGFHASEFALPMNQLEIASFLGCTAPTISRTLKDLDSQRLISMERQNIQIIDFDGLHKMSHL